MQRIRSGRERWWFRCPNHHRSWVAYPDSFHCTKCAQHEWPKDGWYDELIDIKTGDRVTRNQLRIDGEHWFSRRETIRTSVHHPAQTKLDEDWLGKC